MTTANDTAESESGEEPRSGPYSDNVSREEKAGTAEAALLAAKAVTTAAKYIVEALKAKLGDEAEILLYPGTEMPNLTALIAVRAQATVIENVLEAARKESEAADAEKADQQGRDFAGPMAAGVTGVLASLSDVISFFRSDYSAGGIELATDDSMLLWAVAGQMAGHAKWKPLLTPARDVMAANLKKDEVLTQLDKLAGLRMKLGARAKHHKDLAERHTRLADATEKEPKKQQLLRRDKGDILLSQVIRQATLSNALGGGSYILLLKLHFAGGSNYTKKNLWTAFWGMPFFHMGGVVASYLLLKGDTGAILASEVIPLHGGFVKAGAIAAALASQP